MHNLRLLSVELAVSDAVLAEDAGALAELQAACGGCGGEWGSVARRIQQKHAVLSERQARRERERAFLGLGARETPKTFECPVTHAAFVDPVVASDGHTYERHAIEEVLRTTQVSPMTRENLHPLVYPNRALLEAHRLHDGCMVQAATMAYDKWADADPHGESSAA